jgi:serine/threonine-protein kinase
VSDATPPDPPEPTPSSEPTSLLLTAAKEIGTVISDRYRLVELIATGGMGAVYKAEHLLLRKWVAVKLLHRETRNFPEHVLRFEREAIAGAHLQHPNIASATDFGKLPDGAYFLVLEYLRGVPLDRVIRQGALPAARAVKIARQIASALAAAHDRGIIHRDIKPRNIMLDPGQDELVKLIDFGLAKVPVERLSMTDVVAAKAQTSRKITQRDMVFGTVTYMAPEAAEGMDQVDERSDLYALGIILYEMLCGKRPFDGATPVEVFRQQRLEQPPPLKLRNPAVEVPRELEAVVMRLLCKDPTKRYESAQALVAALDEAMPGFAASPREGSSPALGAWRDPPAGSARGGSIPDLPSPAEVAGPGTAPPAEAERERSGPTPARGRDLRPWAIAIIALAVGAIGAVALLRGTSTGDAPADHPADSAAPPATSSAPSAAPSGSAPAAGAPQSDRERIVAAAKAKDWIEGEDALIRLLDADPAAFHERDVMKAAAAITVKSAFRGSGRADPIFGALADRLGADGLDVLYEMVSAHGGTQGAERAASLLRRPDLRARAGAPLRIAIELREADCRGKRALFERAGREGDGRALVVLDLLRPPQCQPKVGQCCFQDNAKLDRAMEALRARLRGQP